MRVLHFGFLCNGLASSSRTQPILDKVLRPSSQPQVAYLWPVNFLTCSLPLAHQLKNQMVIFGCWCYDALSMKAIGLGYGWIRSTKVLQTKSWYDYLGLVDFVKKKHFRCALFGYPLVLLGLRPLSSISGHLGWFGNSFLFKKSQLSMVLLCFVGRCDVLIQI